MDITINKALVLGKVVRERINDLKGLRQNVSTRRTFLGESREVTEPTYDIKDLDKRILQLQQIGFELEAAIKAMNNVITIKVDDNINDVLFQSLS